MRVQPEAIHFPAFFLTVAMTKRVESLLPLVRMTTRRHVCSTRFGHSHQAKG
jgi:hypothetical protein